MCASLFSTDTPRDGGRGRRGAQNRARQFRVKRVCSESAALGFPPCGGRRPRSIERGTTPRTIYRRIGAYLASRGLRLFSRRLGLNEDAAGTLRAGRENRSPPRLAAPSGSPSTRGIFPLGARRDADSRTCGRRARRGRCLGRGGSIGLFRVRKGRKGRARHFRLWARRFRTETRHFRGTQQIRICALCPGFCPQLPVATG